MSGEDRREEAPQDSPWSLDLLADYHAGALDPDTAGQLRVRLEGDLEAGDVLTALEATRTELGEQPELSIPDDVAARLDACLAAEIAAVQGGDDAASPQAPVLDLETARRKTRNRRAGTGRQRSPGTGKTASRRRFGWSAGLVAAAAVALGVIVGAPLLNDTRNDTQAIEPPVATLDPSETPQLKLSGDEVTLTRQQLQRVLGTEQYGALLSDPERRSGCLRANGIVNANPMGAREVTFNGDPAQLLVFPAGDIGKFRVLVVAPRCGAGNPATLSDTTTAG